MERIENSNPSAPVAEHEAVLQTVIVRTPSIKSFRWVVEPPLDYTSGQFVKLTLEGNPVLTRCLSLSSSPSEGGYLEVTKRITQSTFSLSLARLIPGSHAVISAPRGKFVLSPGVTKVAMLSGGIGITPLRSISKYVADSGSNTDICLLYSNRDVDEIAFRDDLEAFAKTSNQFRVVNTLSRANDEWIGRRGRIDRAMICETIPDYHERTFYICGPSAMVNAMSAILRDELLLPKEQVMVERFSGY